MRLIRYLVWLNRKVLYDIVLCTLLYSLSRTVIRIYDRLESLGKFIKFSLNVLKTGEFIFYVKKILIN